MNQLATPLRYPGGKARLAPYVKKLLADNKLRDSNYVEPFCGGAGLALNILAGYVVSDIYLNDLDRSVFAFWKTVTEDNSWFCERLQEVPCTIESWLVQREIWRAKDTADLKELGFATFFLNRTNRSGILAGGVIGGKNQNGAWKIDARFNKVDLLSRVKAIGRFSSRIHVSNLEAKIFLRTIVPSLYGNSLVYLDPPYVEKGPGLYLNSYNEEDHRSLAEVVRNELQVPWMVSYDDHPLIRECYAGASESAINLSYSAYGNGRRVKELLYLSDRLVAPTMSERRGKFAKPWHATVADEI